MRTSWVRRGTSACDGATAAHHWSRMLIVALHFPSTEWQICLAAGCPAGVRIEGVRGSSPLSSTDRGGWRAYSNRWVIHNADSEPNPKRSTPTLYACRQTLIRFREKSLCSCSIAAWLSQGLNASIGRLGVEQSTGVAALFDLRSCLASPSPSDLNRPTACTTWTGCTAHASWATRS